MAAIKAPSNLPKLVQAIFDKARSNGDLIYFPTQVTVLSPSSIPFQLRYSPALASKPRGPSKPSSSDSKPYDPFAEPPQALVVADLPPSHFLVLNKFAVVPGHFILATKAFERQTDLLSCADLAATRACIDAYYQRTGGEVEGGRSEAVSESVAGHDGKEEEKLFAFYNSGTHSGASQPHRHVQLLPVESMREGIAGTSTTSSASSSQSWEVLASDGSMLERLPFATFSASISLGMAAGELHELYLRLYRQACRAVASHDEGDTRPMSTDVDEQVDGEARICYNLAMTRRMLVVCPRTSEGGEITAGPDGGGVGGGDAVGSLSLNGTVLSGSALVKTDREWEALRNDPDKLLAVLRRIGVPRDVTNANKL